MNDDTEQAEKVSLRSVENENAGDQAVGTVFDQKYLIMQLLGAGGFSRVYKALHIHLKKTVAIKFLHAYYASDEDKRQRFTKEARTTSSLSHPNIVAVQDFGYSEDKPYIVMDYVEGKALSELLKDGKQFSLDLILHISSQICEALDAAHSQGIVHRDLKPENIMLLDPDSDKPTVKIVDFGLAKVVQQDGDSLMSNTRTGEVLGTPLYMSPEQCQGFQLDARSDIYSLGCVIYELVSNVKAFAGETPLAVMLQHLNELPRSFANVCPQRHVSAAVEAVVLKALAKKPDARYSTAAELKEAISSAFSDKKGSLRSVLGLMRARSAAKSAGPQRAVTVLAICLFVGISALIALSFSTGQGSKQPVKEVVSDPMIAWGRSQKAGQHAMNTGNYQSAQMNLDQAIKLASTFQKTDKLLLSMKQMAVLLHILNRKTDEARVDFEIKRLASKNLEASNGLQEKPVRVDIEEVRNAWMLLPDDPKAIKPDKFRWLADRTVLVARQCNDDGDSAQAASILNGAIPKLDQILGKDSDCLLGAYGELGRALQAQGRSANAESAIMKALAIAEKRVSLGETGRGVAYLALARMLKPIKGDKWTMLKFQQALELMKKSHGDYRGAEADCLVEIAQLQRNNGDYQGAQETLKQAMQLYSAKKFEMGVRNCRLEIAYNLIDSGNSKQAESTLKEIVSSMQQSGEGEDGALSWYLRSIGIVYCQQANYNKAIHYYQLALEFRQHVLPPEDSETRGLLIELADIYCKQNNFKEAEPLLLEQLAVEERIKTDNPKVLPCISELGCIYASTTRNAEAQKLLAQYLDISGRIRPECYPSGSQRYIFDLLRFSANKPDYQKFEQLLLQSVNTARKFSAIGKLVEAQRLDDLGYLFDTQGKTAEAESKFKEASDLILNAGNVLGPDAASVIDDYVQFLNRQKRYDEAKGLSQQERKIYQAVLK